MATDARVSQETVDQAADDAAALAVRDSQLVVDQAADDIAALEVHMSHMVIDYPMTPVHQCVGGGGIGVLPDPVGGEDFTGRTPESRAWFVLGFDA